MSDDIVIDGAPVLVVNHLPEEDRIDIQIYTVEGLPSEVEFYARILSAAVRILADKTGDDPNYIAEFIADEVASPNPIKYELKIPS